MRYGSSTQAPVGAAANRFRDVVSGVGNADYGDAPAPYPVTLAANGARHFPSALFLGASVDSEADGSPTAAVGDGVDEDGVSAIASFVTATVSTTSSFSVVASAPGKLDAWIEIGSQQNEDQRSGVFLLSERETTMFAILWPG